MTTPERPPEPTPSRGTAGDGVPAEPGPEPAGEPGEQGAGSEQGGPSEQGAGSEQGGPSEQSTEGEAHTGDMPEYKGEPLDAERGPGLGCFWIQIALLTFFLVFTPLTVMWAWDPFISAALLIFTLILLLFSGQTIIFLLRLVAADRRTRRTPLDPSAKPTVGQMEDVDGSNNDASSAAPEPGIDPASKADEDG